MSLWISTASVAPVFAILLNALLVMIILLGIALVVYVVAVFRTEQLCKGIPTPKRSSFFLGNLLLFTSFKEKTSLSSAGMVHFLTKDLGPVFWLRILWRPHFIASSPEIVKELLLNSRHKKPHEVYRLFISLYGERFMGQGLVSEIDHDKWFHRRAIMNPAFRRKYLIGMMEQFNEGAESLCRELLNKADGQTEVAMLDELSNVTLDVIAKISFSMATNATSDPSCPFPSAISTALRGMQRQFDKPWTPIDPRSHSRQLRHDVRKAIKLVRETGHQCIKERIAARQRGDHVPNDILNVILECANDLHGDDLFQMENMIDEFVTLFIAGQETTSNLLAFTIQQLGRNPEVAKKLQAEVDEVLGQKPVIEYEDLAKLEYMMRVLKETLRLYSPVGGTTRVTAHPIKYRDITIPANVNVSVLSAVMARMEEYFDDPLLFNPDRFKIDDSGKLPRHLYAYFPFSLGQRSCIGQQFALIEARVMMGKLLQRFEFRLNQSQRFTILDELTSKPLDKCKNYISLRA